MKRELQDITDDIPCKRVNITTVTVCIVDAPTKDNYLCNLLQYQFRAIPIPTDGIIIHANRLLFPIELLTDAFTTFIKAILRNSYLCHVKHNGLDYYCRTSKWTHRDKNKIYPEHDPDVMCDNYLEDCPIESKDVEGEIKFVVSYHLQGMKIEDYTKLEHDMQKLMQENSHPEKLWLSQFSKIIIENTSGINHDHRGADHLAIKVPFQHSYTIEKRAITVDDFTIGLYATKSHRFDKWYELFTKVKKCSFENGVLKLWLEYDHGS
jgi:hypothetical protein